MSQVGSLSIFIFPILVNVYERLNPLDMIIVVLN